MEKTATINFVFLQPKKNGWGCLEVIHDSESEKVAADATPKKLIILAVDRDAYVRCPVHKQISSTTYAVASVTAPGVSESDPSQN